MMMMAEDTFLRLCIFLGFAYGNGVIDSIRKVSRFGSILQSELDNTRLHVD